MRVLVTGGAGYIGSVFVDALRAHGDQPLVADDLERGHRAALAADVPLLVGDLTDRGFVASLFAGGPVHAVVHFAAWSQVGESMAHPAKYFRNNYVSVLNLLEEATLAKCQAFILSSTAATYGNPAVVPIPESSDTRPTNPYGESKLQCEGLLRWFGEIHGVRWASLRYFNAAGASHLRGEDHDPETHLIPLAIRAALPSDFELSVFGLDYETPDGTCVRDYVHVEDLAEAHLAALRLLRDGRGGVFNLGNGVGFSVLEVLKATEEVAGRAVRWRPGPRRPGDPPRLVASSERARGELGWQPRLGDLHAIVESAWRWSESHPQGYGDR